MKLVRRPTTSADMGTGHLMRFLALGTCTVETRFRVTKPDRTAPFRSSRASSEYSWDLLT